MEIMLFGFLNSLSLLSVYNETPIVPEGNCFGTHLEELVLDQTGTVDLSDMLIMLSLFGDVTT